MHAIRSMARVLIIAAHPDDETLGASALLGGPDEITVIHVTDGAPRDPRWWPSPRPSQEPSRAAYAQLRRDEALCALARANIPATRILELGVVDQEACRELPALARAIAEHLDALAPDLVITHAYEGGHPDHDAVACAVAVARDRVARPPALLEMALYHGAGGGLRAGEFLPNGPSVIHALDLAEQRRRAAMLACFASQQATLAPFLGITDERYRIPPRYDFGRAPHGGRLFYEQLGFPLSGAEWRELAARAHGR